MMETENGKNSASSAARAFIFLEAAAETLYNASVPEKQGTNGGCAGPHPPRGQQRMDELHHECGIAALYHLQSNTTSQLTHVAGPDQVSRLMPRMLLDLQNRGQLAAGFSTFNPRRDQVIDTYRQVGAVIEAFRLNHPAKSESI